MTELRLDPRNARRHSDRNKRQIKQSLDAVGAGRSILADADGIVRAGNGVFAEWGDKPVKIVETDGKELVVVQRTDLRGQDAIRAAALDNLVADSSAFDYDAEILAEIARDDDVIRAIANEDAKLRELLRKENGNGEKQDPGELIDKAAQLQEKWQVRRGDVWQVGKHRLMCGDSTSKEDVDRLMDGKRAQMVKTDPPYNVGYAGGSSNETPRQDAYKDDKSASDYEAWLTIALSNAFGASDDRSAIHLWFSDSRMREVINAIDGAGWQPRDLIIWNKLQAHYGALGAQYKERKEPMWYAFKRGQSPRWYGASNECTVWDCEQPHINDLHPTMKPIPLYVRSISNHTRPDDIVIEMFLGSGTTLVACEQTGRIGYGMEIEPKYCAVSLERLVNLGLQPQRLSDG